MIIIGLSGKMGTGKTTVADMLGLPKLSFAYAVKKECAKRFLFPIEWCYHEIKKNWHINMPEICNFNKNDPIQSIPTPSESMTVRQILQWWGTDVRRKYWGDSYWINKTWEGLKVFDSDVVVIDDVRFLIEVESIRKKGGKVIRLHPYKEWKPGEHANHLSEIELDNYPKFDFEIYPQFGQLEYVTDLINEYIEEIKIINGANI